MKHWVKQSVAALLTGLMLTTSVPLSAFALTQYIYNGKQYRNYSAILFVHMHTVRQRSAWNILREIRNKY